MTYSIIARDPQTGELGVAVQTRYFAVGRFVPWLEPGVGAVATQAFTEPAYGPRGLDAMRGGSEAPEALRRLVAEDQGAAIRQVAMIDAAGRVAAHTGERCVPAAGHLIGNQCSAQGNMVAGERVWHSMVEAYERAQGPLAERLMAALEAGERAGGDIRGSQSAALIVVRAEGSSRHWEDRLIDLRVDDHPNPIGELRRLLSYAQDHRRGSEANQQVRAGDVQGALEILEQISKRYPDEQEFTFRYATALMQAGRVNEAREVFTGLCAARPGWADLLRGLVAAGLLAADPAIVEQVLSPSWRHQGH